MSERLTEGAPACVHTCTLLPGPISESARRCRREDTAAAAVTVIDVAFKVSALPLCVVQVMALISPTLVTYFP